MALEKFCYGVDGRLVRPHWIEAFFAENLAAGLFAKGWWKKLR